MPFYVIDTDATTADGPFAEREDVVEEFGRRADEDRENCYVAEVGEDGNMTVAEVHEWLGESVQA